MVVLSQGWLGVGRFDWSVDSRVQCDWVRVSVFVECSPIVFCFRFRFCFW